MRNEYMQYLQNGPFYPMNRSRSMRHEYLRRRFSYARYPFRVRPMQSTMPHDFWVRMDSHFNPTQNAPTNNAGNNPNNQPNLMETGRQGIVAQQANPPPPIGRRKLLRQNNIRKIYHFPPLNTTLNIFFKNT